MNASHEPPRRLCIVTPALGNVGGSEFQINCLLRVLIPLHRYQIYCLTGTASGNSPSSNSASRDSGSDDCRVIPIVESRQTPRFGYVTHAVPLYRGLRALKPNVIYQRVGCGYSGIAAHYARRHGTRFVWHIAHDSDVVPKESLEGRNPIRRYLEKRSVEYAIRHASCIVAQTTDQARLLERHYRRTADAVIPNFHPAPEEDIDKSGELTVVWIASLKPWKRPEAFLRLAAAARDLPGVQFVMVGPLTAGSGERAWRESLLSRIASTPNLRYLGPLSQQEVNRLLSRAHAFVNTSEYEGFPNTFIQAWMRDVPVVSLHVDPDGILERNGVGIYCAGSEERLADVIRRLLTDAELRAGYAARGRTHAASRHSIANADALVHLLDSD